MKLIFLDLMKEMADFVLWFHSDNSVGSSAAPPKTVVSQEPLIQVDAEKLSENPMSDPPYDITGRQVLQYPLPPLSDGMNDATLFQGSMQYLPQYGGPVPMSPYYPVYQMPIHSQHISCHPNQPYPIYLMPMRPTQYHNIPMPCSSIDANTIIPSSRPPLPPQSAVIPQSVAQKEVFGAQMASAQLVNIPSSQGQLAVGPMEHQIASEPVKPTSVISAIEGSEFDEEIAYNQIYKSQPPAPVLTSHYQTMTKGTAMLPEPSVHAK